MKRWRILDIVVGISLTIFGYFCINSGTFLGGVLGLLLSIVGVLLVLGVLCIELD